MKNINKHIFIKKEEQPNHNMGIIIQFEDEDKNKYHTYLENAEVAQLIEELSYIMSMNLYQIKAWLNNYNEEE